MQVEQNNNPNETKNSLIFFIKEFFAILSDTKNKDAIKSIKIMMRIFLPNPLLKLVYDVLLIFILIGVVIYCADHKYIESHNVQSLLTLIIGAVIGSMFKN